MKERLDTEIEGECEGDKTEKKRNEEKSSYTVIRGHGCYMVGFLLDFFITVVIKFKLFVY